MTNEERIKEAFDRLQVEQEIYLRAFECHALNLHSEKTCRNAMELTYKRLQTAKQNYQVALRWDDITGCARCHIGGIAKDDEKPGDDKIFPILQNQSDSDSQYHKELLCFDCLCADDHYLANRDVTGRGE